MIFVQGTIHALPRRIGNCPVRQAQSSPRKKREQRRWQKPLALFVGLL